MNKQLTDAQVGWAMLEVLEAGRAAERLTGMIQAQVFADDEQATDAVHIALRSLTQRVRMIAAGVAKSLPGEHAFVTDDGQASAWQSLMPPAFFESSQATVQRRGKAA